MFPLLHKDGLIIPYFITTILFFIISHEIYKTKFWNMLNHINEKYLNFEKNLIKTIVSLIKRQQKMNKIQSFFF
jgi:hypothetical protein